MDLESILFMMENEGPAAQAARAAAARLSREICPSEAHIGPAAQRTALVEILRRHAAASVLVCADSARALAAAQAKGLPFCGIAHDGNRGEDLSAAAYVIEEPEQVDADSYEKIWQRSAGLPWRILETERCVVRELAPADAEAVRALYDAEALRFLEPPKEDIAEEREVLAAYARRVYGFYGYGVWGAFLKAPVPPDAAAPDCAAAPDPAAAPAAAACGEGPLVARIGFEPLRQGEDVPSFGYLVHPAYRRKGFAKELCSALLAYGRGAVGFARICARTRADNAASIALLRSLGFSFAADPRQDEGYLYALWPADGVE